MVRSGFLLARGVAMASACAALALWASPARAQAVGVPENPVFVNEALAATDALARALEHAASGNLDQAVRLIQRVLDDDALGTGGVPGPMAGGEVPSALVPASVAAVSRVVGGLAQSPTDPMLYVSVRDRAEQILRSNPVLLERYRAAQGPLAQEMLAAGGATGPGGPAAGGRGGAGGVGGFAGSVASATVERTRFLTAAGLDAALQIAGELMERAQFEAAFDALRRIDTHPDRATREHAPRAARLAAELARYLPTPGVRELAERWAAQADAPVGVPGEPILGPARAPMLSPMGQQQSAEIVGLVPRAVSTAQFASIERNDRARFNSGSGTNLPRGITSIEQLPPIGRDLSVMPLVSGDRVFVSSGTALRAFDRLTLLPVWDVRVASLLGQDDRPDAEAEAGRLAQRMTEDVSSLAARAGLVVAAVPGDSGNREDEQDLVAALDASSGRVRWARWASQIDPQLVRGRVRGPVLLQGDTAVVSIRKDLRERRLGAALYLAGLNVDDGSTRWVALVGSVGALPFARGNPLTDGGTLADGVVYRSDRMGLIGAYVAATGHPLWVRRIASEVMDAGALTDMPTWHMHMPVVVADRVYALSPDRRQLLVIDRATGELVWHVTHDTRYSVRYLLAVGSRLAMVEPDAVSIFTPGLTPQESSPIERVTFEQVGAIRGRVVAADGKLLVPVIGGVEIIDPDQPYASRQRVPLDDSGSLVADAGRLLVADDARLHSYLTWEAGERLLGERIATSTADASAALALAEFAHRAGHPERILSALDAARGAIHSATLPGVAPNVAQAAEGERTRLVRVLRRFIADSLAPVPRGGDARPAIPADLRLALIERLGSVASTPDERVAHLLLQSRAQELAGSDAEAVASCSAVLASTELSQAVWEGDRVSVRADAEATRRLEDLLARRGRTVFSKIDVEFDKALAALLGPRPPTAKDAPLDPDVLETLARRYPLAPGTPALWGRVAALYATLGRPRAAARALEMGLHSAERMPDAPPSAVGELAADLITNLRDRNLFMAAQEILRRTRSRFPGLALGRPGTPLDAGRLSDELARLVGASQRWPAVGTPVPQPLPDVFTGWAIVEPAIKASYGIAPLGLVLRHEDGRVALVAPEGQEPGAKLASVWSAGSDNDPVELVRLERDAATFFLAASGGVLKRIETAGGLMSWSTRPFAQHFEGPAPYTRNEVFKTPAEGTRRYSELIVCTDGRTTALVERSGRTVAYDGDSGATLWAGALPLARVFDSDVAGSTLIVAGERDQRRADGSVTGTLATILVVDARTGRVVHEVEPTVGPIRWLRMTNRGDVMVGGQLGVLAIDPESGQTIWTNTDAPAAAALRAWALGQSLLLVSADRSLWSLALSTGVAHPVASMGPNERTMIETSADPQAYAIADGGLALCSSRGLAIIDHDGNQIGGDALASEDALVGPVPADGLLVTIDSGSASRAPGNAAGSVYGLHLLENRSGRIISTTPLLLPDQPQRITLMDGRIAITAGRSTIVYSSPAH